MRKRRRLVFKALMLVAAVVAWSCGSSFADQQVTSGDIAKKFNKVSREEQKAAAKRARALGLKPGIAGKAETAPEAQPGTEEQRAKTPAPQP